MQRVGSLVADRLDAMRQAVAPEVTTAQLDDVAARHARCAGAWSAPQLTYGFPGFTSITVNEQTVQGIPGPKVLQPGDTLELSVTLEHDGCWTLRTAKRALAVHHERTIMICAGAPLVLTVTRAAAG